MGNFLTRSCYDQPNINSLQITIEGLVKENEELKKKLESLEIENSDKNIIVKNNNLDVIEDQLKSLIKPLRQAKIETIKYYRDKEPKSYSVVFGTDLIKDYIKDIKTLLDKDE